MTDCCNFHSKISKVSLFQILKHTDLWLVFHIYKRKWIIVLDFKDTTLGNSNLSFRHMFWACYKHSFCLNIKWKFGKLAKNPPKKAKTQIWCISIKGLEQLHYTSFVRNQNLHTGNKTSWIVQVVLCFAAIGHFQNCWAHDTWSRNSNTTDACWNSYSVSSMFTTSHLI